MKITKEEILGYLGSAAFCLILILVLYFTFLHTQVKAEEEGVLVNFGNVDFAAGTFEPKAEGENRQVPSENVSPTIETPQQSETPAVITQTDEQTVAIKAEDKEKMEREKKEAEQRRIAEEQRKRAEEERKQREAINQQMANAFGAGDTSKGNEGTAADGAGNQGSNEGNAPTGSYTGVGGIGNFDLNGRSLGAGGLQRPAYAAQEEGTIVVEITVDPKGNVINADIRLKGTNIENANMRRSALEAARKTKFNVITGTQNQIGSITYRYSLK
ncbi:TonB family protein [Dysgonomonadaceae bacterium PH5-43]|nr:TonB family protein [Dysgonomonadaceae bacterium PH5-43]